MKLRELLALEEGIEDRIEAAREKALKNGKKINDEETTEKKSNVNHPRTSGRGFPADQGKKSKR